MVIMKYIKKETDLESLVLIILISCGSEHAVVKVVATKPIISNIFICYNFLVFVSLIAELDRIYHVLQQSNKVSGYNVFLDNAF